MRDAFADELAKLAAVDERIMFLTGDLGFGVFEKFKADFPKQYLNVGVAEQNMVAVATGLALEGRIAFTYSIGNFPVLRCLEQIRNDAAYHGANVKVVSVGGGFSYGPLGMSHHATEDLAVMRAIPEVSTFVPGTKAEVVDCLHALIETDGTCYLRLDKSAGTEPDTLTRWTPGTWRVLTDGSDVTLVAAGGVLGEVQDAAQLLESEGISVRVVSALQLAPIGNAEVIDAIGDVAHVITVEEHVVSGGLGGLVAEVLADTCSATHLTRCGIDRFFVSEVGSQRYLREKIGLDAISLARTAKNLLESD